MKENNLYLVATPIGNLEDMTYRGVRILQEVDEIYCEDTRVTAVLCRHYGIKKPLYSYHKFNEEKRTEEILTKLHAGRSIALVSDQGMPGISDPGQVILRQAIKEGFEPILAPGASSVLMAAVLAGLGQGSFSFLGFIPRKGRERQDFLDYLQGSQVPSVFFESVHRLQATLADLAQAMPDRNLVLARELTKKYEEVLRGTVLEILEEAKRRQLKGEFVLVLDATDQEVQLGEEAIKDLLLEKMAGGLKKSRAIKEVAQEYKLPKNQVYAYGLELDS